jgi:uncharacterized protein YndB with AHSA1/START domain
MSEQKTKCVLVLTRVYDAPVEQVWRAWTDAAELGRWYMAGGDHVIHFAEADVRVGGLYRIGFGPPGKMPYVETGRYTEIVPLKRLAFEEAVTLGETDAASALIHAELIEIDFTELGDGRTQIVLTDTGPDSWRSGEGWLPCFDSLERHLARVETPA